MEETNKIYSPFAAFFFLCCIAGYWYYHISVGNIPLTFDEAQYWTWSKSFELGYYSKPPIVAWLIGGMSEYCGDTVLCIKSSSVLMQLLTSMVVFGIADNFYSRRIAFWSAITYATLPGVSVGAALISADAPLMLFWALSIYCFTRAIELQKDRYWVFMGIFVGLGLLSKYTMLVYFPSMVLCILTAKYTRDYAWSLSLWASAVIAATIYSPNFLWNMTNNFVSFQHTGENVLSNGNFSLDTMAALEFIGGQIAIFGPILSLALVFSSFKIFSLYRTSGTRLLLSFTWPLLFVAIAISLVSGAQAHWAAPAYITATILVVKYMLEKNKMAILTASLILHVFAMVVIYNINIFAPILSDKIDPFARVKMWNELDKYVTQETYKYPNAFVLSDERKAVASLMYHMRTADNKPYPIIKWNPDKIIHDHYELTTNMNNYVGQNFIFVTRRPDMADVAKYFETTEELQAIELYGEPFSIHYLTSFKGY